MEQSGQCDAYKVLVLTDGESTVFARVTRAPDQQA